MDGVERTNKPARTRVTPPPVQSRGQRISAPIFCGQSGLFKGRATLLPPRQRLQLVCLCILLVSCLAGSLTTVITSLIYTPLYARDMALARVGIQHLRQAQSLLLSLEQQPFNQEHIKQAQQEFAGATRNFELVDADVQTLSPLLLALPFLGPRLQAARHLVPLADDFSQAGEAGCRLLLLLTNRLHDPLNTNTSRPMLSTDDMQALTDDLHTFHLQVRRGLYELDQVPPAEMQFGKQIDGQLVLLRRYEPRIQVWLNLLERALPRLPVLLGLKQPGQYLLEMLDSSELRPAGGFIGNYGFLTLENGRLQSAHIVDVDLLDLPFQKAGGDIPFPPEYRWFPLAHGQWSFRDSNLDADFPTAARSGLHNFQLEGGDASVQGVIAITPELIRQALTITGPIAIPEYGDTVTSDNLVERIHYYQLGAGRHGSGKIPSADGLSSERKHFTALLAEDFFARLHHLSNSEMGKFVHLLLHSVQTKDLQLYFTDARIEALLRQGGIDGSIQQAPDGLFVVDANVNGNKANSFIDSTVTDVVNIDSAGNAIHSLTLRYAWTTPGDVFGNALYRAYIQVYAPLNSQLQQQNGWDEPTQVQREQHTIWSGSISLLYGDTRTVELSWIVPHAVQRDAQGVLHYHYLMQRQAGIDRTLHLQVRLPPCATIQSTSGASFERSEQTAWLVQNVTQDLPAAITYTCS